MIDTLKTLLAPGGRSRLSPYVQDAQLQVLFGEAPSAHNRYENLRALLKKHEASVQHLADTYTNFARSKRQFLPSEYRSEDFLRLYLAYYFTTNVCKIQLCLLDHVATNRIPSRVSFVDIGVGSGTTAIAVLDFLLAWLTICHLRNQPFPIEHIEILCYDVSQQCLAIAKEVVISYCEKVSERRKNYSAKSSISVALEHIYKWGTSIKWINHDMSHGPIKLHNDLPAFLFASNILQELTPVGRKSLELSISSMGPDSIANIIEPGDKLSCQGLNAWRSSLINDYEGLCAILPCKIHSGSSTKYCCSCWNSRRESLHQPLLYMKLRELTNDPRSFDDYSNNLLSWSYTTIVQNTNFISDVHNEQANDLKTQAFGTYRWGRKKQQFYTSALDTDAPEGSEYIDYLKLCPASHPGAVELWARREPGFILPPVPHGATLRIIGAQVEQSSKKPGIFTLKLTQSTNVETEIPQSNNHSFLDQYGEDAREAIDEISFRLFGFPSMRPFQHEILKRILMGHSILGIAATGGGKSECYILPSLLFSGVTIVISPLKSLMQDQYEKRIDERYGLKNLSTYINGDVPFIERQARLKRLELGHYVLVYFTPEQLRHSHVLNSLKRAHHSVGIRYLALDEAHCISQWGHDFRDSYLNIVTRLTTIGINPVIIALTATASPEVRVDLCEELCLKNEPLTAGGDVYVHSSNRPELNLIVKSLRSTHDKVEDIVSRLKSLQQNNKNDDNSSAAIVFMPHTGNEPNTTDWPPKQEDESINRGRYSARVTNFASFLERALETHVAIYHGKMDFDICEPAETEESQKKFGDLSNRSRRSEQTAFIEGKRSIMVATKGFGMGIDKPNIRLVIHRSPTGNLESYAQEAGRAGRDGVISDVILYYSPDKPSEDAPNEKKDYDIQDFFLSQKYIRRDDVIAIKNFFNNTKTHVNGFTYFTSDEVVPFFDHLEQNKYYTWPTFSQRIKRLKESEEHAQILNKGHLYLQKINYIDRILSALYRFRPNINNNKKITILDRYQETGAILCFPNNYPTVCNSESIINSNYYFGDLLREKRVSPSDFKNWIERCTKESIIEFSLFLGLSISETASMLWDINRSSGYICNGRWKSDLLDFIYIGTPKCKKASNISLAELREYYGASKRASKSEAQCRAEYASKRGEHRDHYKGEISPSLNDWFGLKELATPKGWEVRFGSGLKDETIFQQYVDEFMKLHDLRKKNDRAAYNLLLTDYIGVREDGSLSVNNNDKPCLRAVLLGYLKTGEVVLGNCGSCSRCVTNGKFEKDITKREKAVERLGIEITNLLDLMEKSNLRIPTEDLIMNLWRHVESQEAEGKSLRAYVGGWTGRVLTDNPKHKSALLIRIDGMLKGALPLLPKEACGRALELIEIISTEELNSIWNTIETFNKILPDVQEAMEVRATALHKLEKFEQARDLWQTLANQSTSKQLLHKCHSNLAKLTDLKGPLADESQFIEHAMQAARTTTDVTVSTEFYNRAKTFWPWSDFKQELKYHQGTEGEIFGDKLISWWIGLKPGIASLLSSSPSEDWVKIIDESLPELKSENVENYHLDKKIFSHLDKWTVEALKIHPTFFAVRALRIALIKADKNGNPDEFAFHALKLLENNNKPLRNWLTKQIDSTKLKESHYSTQIVLAEIAFQEGLYASAKEYCHNFVDSTHFNAPESLIIHALTKIISMHKEDGPLPDKKQYNTALFARAKLCQDWNSAKPFFCELLSNLKSEEISDTIIKFFSNNKLSLGFNLLELYINTDKHDNSINIFFSILERFESLFLNQHIDTIYQIARNIKPQMIVSNTKIGSILINKVFQDFEKLQEEKNISYYDLTDEWCIKLLTHGLFTGLINNTQAIKLNLSTLIFEDANTDLASNLSTEFAHNARELILKGENIDFFQSYIPNSLVSLDRWLEWFISLRPTHENIIDNVISSNINLFQTCKSKKRSEIELINKIGTKYEICRKHIENFNAIQSFVNKIYKIENETSLSSATKIDVSYFNTLGRYFKFKNNELDADIHIAILTFIIKRTNPNWMTPIQRLYESLIKTNRVHEAEKVKKHFNLNCSFKSITNIQRHAPAYAKILDDMAEIFLKNWNINKNRWVDNDNDQYESRKLGYRSVSYSDIKANGLRYRV